MNKIYSFLFLVLLLGLGYAASLLSYAMLDNDFFVFGIFVLGTLFVFSVIFFGSWLGALFSLVFFSITLLTGIIGFSALVPENYALFGMLLISGTFGFVGTLLCHACKKSKKRFKPVHRNVPLTIPAYNLEKPEQQPTQPTIQPITLESFDDFSGTGGMVKDDDFIELQDVDKLVKAEKKSAKRGNGKKRM